MKCVPRLWKIEKICAIPKVLLPTVGSDYRPISLLPIISKVFERIILNQLEESLDQHQVLCSMQSGYRKGHSCVTILHKPHNNIQTSLNKDEVTLVVMADYNKAFDTVTYLVLIKKIKELKFTNSFKDLIINYLSDHQQFVQIDYKNHII